MHRIVQPLTLTLFILIFSACGSSKKAAEVIEKAPEWVISRPVTSIYYTGIGITKKWGLPDTYKADARQKALADMASQVNTNVSTTSVLHTVENKKGISELYSNSTKTSSLEFLEGYQEVDSYEDGTYYYVYYQLSKSRFAQIKSDRKHKALSNAMSKYKQALKEEKSNNTSAALKLYASSLEAMVNYLGDDNLAFDSISNKNIDVCVESAKKINKLTNELSISSKQKTINAKTGSMVTPRLLNFTITNANQVKQSNIPVKFKYSNGFLRKDNALSDTNGNVSSTIHKVNDNGSEQSFCAEIDIRTLTQNLTSNLLIRKMIEDTGGNSVCISIQVSN